MYKNSASEEIRIDLEDTAEQHGIHSNIIPENAAEGHSANQTAEDSTLNGMKGAIEDRDPRGVNKCLKVG